MKNALIFTALLRDPMPGSSFESGPAFSNACCQGIDELSIRVHAHWLTNNAPALGRKRILNRFFSFYQRLGFFLPGNFSQKLRTEGFFSVSKHSNMHRHIG